MAKLYDEQHDILFTGVFYCEQAALNPHCSFSVPGMWTRQMQKDVTANGGYYSIKFWMKPLENFLDSEGGAQPLIFYQSLSPPVILTEVYINTMMGGLNVSFFVPLPCRLGHVRLERNERGVETVEDKRLYERKFRRKIAAKQECALPRNLKISFSP